MKPEQWNEGLNHLAPHLVEEYVTLKDTYAQKRKPRKFHWAAAVAAVLALAIGLGMLIGGTGGITPPPNSSMQSTPTQPSTPGTQTTPTQPSTPGTQTTPTQPSTPGTQTTPTQPSTPGTQTTPTSPGIILLENLVAAPKYPDMEKAPVLEDFNGALHAYSDAYRAWKADQSQYYDPPKGYADSLTDFFGASMTQFLQGTGNPTYSPLNVYMAMAMLAETTGGNSRQQILNLFGVETIEALREQVSHLWNAHYRDDGETTLLLANSLWLDEAFSFKKPTVQLLADRYYASSFHGDLGTEKLDKQLQAWLNTNTGDLLKDQVENVKMDPQTVFALASTVNFAAGWNKKFSEGNTKNAVFHALNGDITTPFMNKTILSHTYYRGKNFGAIALELTGSNRMWLILPDEGYTTADILASEEYLRMTLDPGSWESKGAYTLHLSLPKFDVVNQTDLTEGIKAMGVTDIFDRTASNFTPITDTPMLAVNGINHAARVSIDEDGCVAAAFTVINPPTGGPPPDIDKLDFVLDRPFLFMVSGRDNLPLFAGVVNEP